MKWLTTIDGNAINADHITLIKGECFSRVINEERRNTGYQIVVFIDDESTDIIYREECPTDQALELARMYIAQIVGWLNDEVPDTIKKTSSKPKDIPLEDLDLSVRAFNRLHRAGIKTVADLRDALSRGKVMKIPGFGPHSLKECLFKLELFDDEVGIIGK